MRSHLGNDALEQPPEIPNQQQRLAGRRGHWLRFPTTVPDKFATDGEHEDKIKEKEEQLTLHILRTGSTWARTAAYWSGKADDKICQLCLEEEEKGDHLWRCCKFMEKATEIDVDLAAINQIASH